MIERYEPSSLVKKCALDLRKVPAMIAMVPHSDQQITVHVASDTEEVRDAVHRVLAACGYQGTINIVRSEVPILVPARKKP